MFIATATLLVQFLAIPAQALPVTADAVRATAPEISSTQPEVTPGSVPSDTGAEASDTRTAEGALEAKAIYMPVLLPQPAAVATPVEPASSSSALIRVVTPSAAAVEKERRWEERQKRIWKVLDIAQSGAATFDAWSTRRVVANGVGQEMNPMLRPFAGNDSLYAAIQVAPLALDYIGHRMITSHHSWARHTWWIPQAVGTAVSFASGVNNLAVYGAR